MNNQSKRLLTILLALFMILTSFPLNAFAAQTETNVRNEITDIRTVGDKQVINLGTVKGQSRSNLGFFSRSARLFGARTQQAGSSSETVAQKVEISLTKMGLNLEEDQFDPSALTEVGSFDVEITFKELGGTRAETRTMTFQAGDTKKTETFYLPKDFGNGNVEAEIPKLKQNISLRVYNGAGGTTNFTLGQEMTYKFELTQIVHPVIDLKVVDPYGKELQENINQDLGLKLALAADHTFNLPANTKTLNIRTLGDFAGDNVAELNDAGENPTLDLTTSLDANKKLKVGDKTYKLNKITYKALGQEVEINGQKKKVGGYIEFATQPKIIVPTPDDSGDLPKTPDGYKRLSFHAETSSNANDGKFENGEKLKVIDVLEGTNFNDTDLLKEIGKIKKPYPMLNGRKDDQKKFLKWNPALPTDKTTGEVADTEYWPVYLKDGGEITPGEKLPDGVFEVKVIKDDTVAADDLFGKSYGVFDGSTLARDKFPDLEVAKGYQNPKWTTEAETPATGMVDIKKPWTKVIHKATTFKATAGADAATQIKKEGLKAVDTTALQGQDLTEAFWHKGVALADNTPADKKDAFAALLKDATVTDKSSRTTAEAGDKVGILLVTFKDGSTLEVPNQKLIVKPNTVEVAFDKAEGKEHPLRDGDTTVKGKISASSNSAEFPVSLDGAVVTIKKGDTVLSRTLAKADGSFVAGVKDPLIAGEDISVVVTLPESKTESAPVTEKVQLNPDKLNEIIPTGEELVKNLKGKKGVDQTKVETLEKAIQKATDDLVEKDGKVKSKVEVSPTGQKSLDNQYEAIKKAIEALTGNTAPEIKGTSHKEIFKDDALNLEEGITVTDKDSTEQVSDIAQVNNKDFTYKVEKIEKDTRTEITKENLATINQKAGTYEVTYTAKDKSGAEGTFVMTLVVREPVVEIKDNFPDPIPDGYVKVEFKEGAHGKLEGTTKFLVKDGSAKTILNAPTVKPNNNWKVNEKTPWEPAIPATFTGTEENKKSFVFTAQYTYNGPDVVEEEPGKGKPDVPSDFVKVEFKKGLHGVISSEEKFAFWVNPEKEVTLTAPTVTPSHGYKHTGWKPEVKANTKYTEAKEFVAQYKATVVTEDPNDKEHYAKVEFNAGDQGKFEQVDGKDQVTTFWVWKGEKISFNAPKVTANENYKFKEWDKPIQETYDADTTHTATYESTLNISDKEVKGYQEVKFMAGSDGNFGKDGETPITTKSVWVKPDTLVDLTDKAPQVTVTTTGKSFIGWDQKLVGKFAKAATATVINAKYDDTVKTTEPTENKDKYAKVDFVAGNLGTIENSQKTTFWVVKGQKVTDTFKAPTVTPVKDWIVDTKKPWDPVVADKYDKDTIHVAQYKATVVTEDPQDKNYVTVEFLQGEHGTLEGTAKFWVFKNKEVEFNPPTVKANAGYTFDKWDPEVKTSYAEAAKHTATYTTNSDISETEVKGYQEVKFLSGSDGNFGKNGETPITEKSLWVNPNKEVDLTDKAPKVTVTNDKKGFIGWNKDLVGTFAKSETATEITAQYKDKVVTEDPQDRENYAEVEFLAGTNGKFEQVNSKDQTTKFWVLKNEKVTIDAPQVTPNSGYSFTGWKEPVKEFYAKDTKHTAQYNSIVDTSTTEVKGWTKITFLSGEHGNFGTFKGTPITTSNLWVNPAKEIALKDAAPKTDDHINWTFKNWKDANDAETDLSTPANYTSEATFTANYESDFSDELKKGFVKVTFRAGRDGNFGDDGFGGELKSKDVYVRANKEVDLSTQAPKVTANAKKVFTAWAIKAEASEKPKEVNIKKISFAKETNLVAQYEDDEDGDGIADVKQKTTIDSLMARNIGTGDPKQKATFTTIEGVAEKGSVVTITFENNGQKVNKTVEADKTTGVYKLELKGKTEAENILLPAGTEVSAQATFGKKQPSDTLTEEVFDDLDDNKIPDGQAGQTERPAAIASNRGDDPKFTTIKVKAEKGSVITVKAYKVEKQGEKLVRTELGEVSLKNNVANSDDFFDVQATLDDKPLPSGTEILVYAKNAPKTISKEQTTTVFDDFDEDGKPDGGKVDLTNVESIQVIPPKNMKYTQGQSLDGTGLQAVVIDKKGNIEIFDYDPEAGTFKDAKGKEVEEIKASVNGQAIATVEKDGEDKTKVTPLELRTEYNNKPIDVKVGDKTGSTNQKLEVTQDKVATPTVKALNVGTNPTFTTITGKTEANAEVTIKVDNQTITVTANADGDYEAKVTKGGTPDGGALPKDTDVEVVAKVTNKLDSDPAKTKVDVDFDGDGKADSKKPTVDGAKSGDKVITGTAAPGAEVVVKVTPKASKENPNPTPVEKTVTAGPDGTYTVKVEAPIKDLEDGDTIVATATEPGKTPAVSDTVTVGVDFTELDKAIKDGNGELAKRNDGTPADKELEKAIQEGENLKTKDPAPTKEEVDNATKKINDAIDAKKAYDEARDKLQEKINEANDKKNDPEYPNKPDDVKKELDESATEGQTTHDNKDSSKEAIDKAIEKIQEKIDQYNKQQIGVNIRKVTSNDKTIVVVVTAPNAKVEVFKSEVDWTTFKTVLTPIGERTDITRLLIVSLDNSLPTGTKLFIKVTHPDYLSYEDNITVE